MINTTPLIVQSPILKIVNCTNNVVSSSFFNSNHLLTSELFNVFFNSNPNLYSIYSAYDYYDISYVSSIVNHLSFQAKQCLSLFDVNSKDLYLLSASTIWFLNCIKGDQNALAICNFGYELDASIIQKNPKIFCNLTDIVRPISNRLFCHLCHSYFTALHSISLDYDEKHYFISDTYYSPLSSTKICGEPLIFVLFPLTYQYYIKLNHYNKVIDNASQLLYSFSTLLRFHEFLDERVLTIFLHPQRSHVFSLKNRSLTSIESILLPPAISSLLLELKQYSTLSDPIDVTDFNELDPFYCLFKSFSNYFDCA